MIYQHRDLKYAGAKAGIQNSAIEQYIIIFIALLSLSLSFSLSLYLSMSLSPLHSLLKIFTDTSTLNKAYSTWPSQLETPVKLNPNSSQKIYATRPIFCRVKLFFFNLLMRQAAEISRSVHTLLQQYFIYLVRCQIILKEDMDWFWEFLDFWKLISLIKFKKKNEFFQALTISVQTYGCTTWTLTKRLRRS